MDDFENEFDVSSTMAHAKLNTEDWERLAELEEQTVSFNERHQEMRRNLGLAVDIEDLEFVSMLFDCIDYRSCK